MGSGLLRVSIGVLVICALGAATAFLRSGEPHPRPDSRARGVRGPGWAARRRAGCARRVVPAPACLSGRRDPAAGARQAARQADRLELAVAAQPSLDWTSIGPQSIHDLDGSLWSAGRVTAVAPVGDGTVAYLGAAQGGVWKTTDAGVHWAPVLDDAAAAAGTGLAIGSLAVDPANSSTIYAGTGEANLGLDSYFGGGILKSTNAGSTWAKVGGGVFDTCHVADLEIRGGTILASTVRIGRWTRSCVGGSIA